jgi:glyoxylase-like metal-dependent hydrolase (beta-lactamase superfamily II)
MNPTLIELKQNKPGFRRFIGSWLITGRENIVVDVGPSNSIDQLIHSLTESGVDRIDRVLLTHIHIDHAGGLAPFIEHFPMARVVCHEKAISHLVDPSKLWAGARKTLGGDLTDTYGPIMPVKKEWLVPHTEAKREGLEIVETPGHAAHHLCFIVKGFLFAGEAGGVHFTVGDSEYLRPATPPVFFMNQFLESIDRLLSHETMPICYSHFRLAANSHAMLRRQKTQLILWKGIIKEELSRGENGLIERSLDALLRTDPELKAFSALSPEDQERERFFMGNCIEGYRGFLSLPPAS